jgi:magnesium transporter
MPIQEFQSSGCPFIWLDVVNPTNEEVQKLSIDYKLHLLTLRDCLEPDHLPKRENLGDIQFLITRLLTGQTDQKADSIQEMSNKVAIFYSRDFLITIHRKPQEFLFSIKDSVIAVNPCKTTNEIVTKILWHVLNTYDKPGINLSVQVDSLEREVFLKAVNTIIPQDLYYIKRKASVCQKLLILSTEAINSLRSDDMVAIQDVKDLHIKLMNMYGQIYEDVTNLLNIYLSMNSQKTNDVMKVLTIFSVFFMPLTFIAGIYGMNFQFMPELGKRWGYPACLALMAISSAVIYLWFKRKKWL